MPSIFLWPEVRFRSHTKDVKEMEALRAVLNTMMMISMGIPSWFSLVVQYLDLGAFRAGEAYYEFGNTYSVEQQ